MEVAVCLKGIVEVHRKEILVKFTWNDTFYNLKD